MADARARAERTKSGVPSRDVQKTDEKPVGKRRSDVLRADVAFRGRKCDRVLRDVRKTRRGESGVGGPFGGVFRLHRVRMRHRDGVLVFGE